MSFKYRIGEPSDRYNKWKDIEARNIKECLTQIMQGRNSTAEEILAYKSEQHGDAFDSWYMKVEMYNSKIHIWCGSDLYLEILEVEY